MTDPESHLDCGLYSIGDAARLLAVTPNKVRYWIGETEVEPVIPRRFADEGFLTFSELMELHFIKLFRDKGVSFQAIRKAAIAASERFHTAYPFTVKQFDTNGKTIFATLRSKEKDKELMEDLERGQYVFTTIVRPFFKKIDYGKWDARRFWPMKKSGRIVLDPSRRFGQPIDDETGVPTKAIIDAINAGDGQDVPEVARWFDIPPEAVKAAIRFERSLAP